MHNERETEKGCNALPQSSSKSDNTMRSHSHLHTVAYKRMLNTSSSLLRPLSLLLYPAGSGAWRWRAMMKPQALVGWRGGELLLQKKSRSLLKMCSVALLRLLLMEKCISYIYPRACTKLNYEFLKKTSTYCNYRPSTECLCFVLSTERTAFRVCSQMLTSTC